MRDAVSSLALFGNTDQDKTCGLLVDVLRPAKCLYHPRQRLQREDALFSDVASLSWLELVGAII